MKKFYFKLIAAAFLMIGSLSFVSCKDEEPVEVETELTVNDLPSEAQSFLKKYFYGYTVTKVEKDVEDNITIYEVTLQDDYVVVFNSMGDWTQVEAPYGKTIPTGFIPEQILSTLNQRFPGYGINEINTTGEGYKVELSDNQGGAAIDIFFDMSGEITGIDQLD